MEGDCCSMKGYILISLDDNNKANIDSIRGVAIEEAIRMLQVIQTMLLNSYIESKKPKTAEDNDKLRKE